MVKHEEETCSRRWLAIFNSLLGVGLVYIFFVQWYEALGPEKLKVIIKYFGHN